MMLAQPRIFHAMANDGLLPALGRPHPSALAHTARHDDRHRRRGGAGGGLHAGVAMLGQLVSIGTLFAFVVVAIGVLFLRARRPELQRPFRVPWVAVSADRCRWSVSMLLMASLPWATWERLVIWMALGLAIYVAYGYRHSRVRLPKPVDQSLA